MGIMIIDGKLNKYKVNSENSGWSWAVPVLKIKKKFLFLPFSRWVKVWEGEATSRILANKMKPCEKKQWFTAAVREYEDHRAAWDSYYANQ